MSSLNLIESPSLSFQSTSQSHNHHSEIKTRTNISLQQDELNLDTINQYLISVESSKIIAWAEKNFGEGLVMSTSFGIQAAVMLHLVTQIIPNIPIIWIDTGYLPTETYIFADELTKKLNLNLKVFQSPLSPARMEALYGKLWQKNDLESLNLYDQIRKVEPMQRALRELKATAWLAGLRQNQTNFRQQLKYVNKQGNQYKILPILTWTSQEVYKYLTEYDLPYHPYFDQGYVSVGDWHSSRPLTADDNSERDTRFHGVKQECGLHLPLNADTAQSLDSSQL